MLRHFEPIKNYFKIKTSEQKVLGKIKEVLKISLKNKS